MFQVPALGIADGVAAVWHCQVSVGGAEGDDLQASLIAFT